MLNLRGVLLKVVFAVVILAAGPAYGVTACCSIFGICTIATGPTCPSGSIGTHPNTTCSPNPCKGACCTPSGNCTMVTLGLECTLNQHGVYSGGGTTCPNVTCPSSGACCTNNACVPSFQTNCTTGVFTPNAPCDPVQCPPLAACCRAGQCVMLTSADCGEHLWRGEGTTCSPNFCCPADFNHSGFLSVQDIFDFLAGYFGNDPNADFNHTLEISVQDIFDFLAAYFAGCPG